MSELSLRKQSSVETVKAAAKSPTVCVDFDGTIVSKDKFDFNLDKLDIRPGVRKWMKEFKSEGFKIIIFTVRGQNKEIAEWLEDRDIPFDHINENPDQPPNTSHKPIADVYIDDRGVDARPAWSQFAPEVIARLKGSKE